MDKTAKKKSFMYILTCSTRRLKHVSCVISLVFKSNSCRLSHLGLPVSLGIPELIGSAESDRKKTERKKKRKKDKKERKKEKKKEKKKERQTERKKERE